MWLGRFLRRLGRALFVFLSLLREHCHEVCVVNDAVTGGIIGAQDLTQGIIGRVDVERVKCLPELGVGDHARAAWVEDAERFPYCILPARIVHQFLLQQVLKLTARMARGRGSKCSGVNCSGPGEDRQ